MEDIESDLTHFLGILSIDWVGIFNCLFTDVLFWGFRNNNIVKLGSKFGNDKTGKKLPQGVTH